MTRPDRPPLDRAAPSRAAAPVARGRLIVISGPSGAGKSTVARHLLQDPRYARARTATTRPPRGGERPGDDYDFLSEEAFRAGLAQGDFLEHAVVYGHLYGTPRRNPEAILASGRNCVLVLDVQGARTLRSLGVEGTYVFVRAPDREELRRRLRARGEDDEAAIERRLAAADRELEEARRFDLIVVNDDVAAAAARLVESAGLEWTPSPPEE